MVVLAPTNGKFAPTSTRQSPKGMAVSDAANTHGDVERQTPVTLTHFAISVI